MSDSPNPNENQKIIDRTALLQLTIFVEAFILLGATFWSQVSDIALAPYFDVQVNDLLLGALVGFSMAIVSFILFWLGKFVPGISDLRSIILNQVAPIFSQLTWLDMLLIALASGFCEEVMFRGVVQQQYGIWGASFAFGLFHCPSLKHLSYGLWAFAAGLLLGWLVIYTGSLWPAILAHALSNQISLVFLRWGVKTEKGQI